MKRLLWLLYLILAVVVVIGLAGCGESNQQEGQDNEQNVNEGGTGNENNDQINDVTEIPRERDQEIEVVGVEELHPGRVWDISPDRKKLLFSWDEEAAESDRSGEMRPPSFLYTLNLEDQTVEKLITSRMNQGFAKYSPGGEKIAFMENEGEIFFPFIMESRASADKIALEGEEDHNLLFAPPLSWSTDGEIIAAAKWYMERGQILLFDETGNEQRVITGGKMRSPYFMDGETLLFIKDDFRDDATSRQESSIVALDLTSDDAVAKKITAGIEFIVSPNKQRLAYIPRSSDDGSLKMQVAALDSDLERGSVLAEVNVDWSLQFAWSPDSRYLLYADSGSIWLIDPETKEKKELASGMNFILNLHWPSNDEIIFSAIASDAGDDTARIYRIKLA